MTQTSSDQDTHNKSQNQVILSLSDATTLLRGGQMKILQLMPWSSNYTFLVEISQAEKNTLAIYKPRRGERPLWDFPNGTLYQREVAAFVVSNALNLNIVPPTVVRQGEHGIGMVQLFIEHDPEEHFFTFRDPWPEELTRMALLDALINNADRKGGHCLRDKQGHIWGIDHGICFHEEYKLRTVIWEPAGQPIPTTLLNHLCTLQHALQQHAAPHNTLSHLLSATELAALKQRLATLIEAKHFPVPPPGERHIPWPLV